MDNATATAIIASAPATDRSSICLGPRNPVILLKDHPITINGISQRNLSGWVAKGMRIIEFIIAPRSTEQNHAIVSIFEYSVFVIVSSVLSLAAVTRVLT